MGWKERRGEKGMEGTERLREGMGGKGKEGKRPEEGNVNGGDV